MSYRHIKVPSAGRKIEVARGGVLQVPDHPVMPYLEGDGIGSDISPVMCRVVDAAVAKAYSERRQIHWMEVFAGAKAARLYGGEWYPAETLDAISEFVMAVQGPLALPIGAGFRSLNVALRHEFDLYASVSPVRFYEGMSSPLRHPEGIDLVLFRETSEDAYSAIEWKAGSRQADRMVGFLCDEMGVTKLRFPDQCAIGIKPVSAEGSRRLIRRAIQYAIDHDRPSVTLIHKGNVMRHTEGAFLRWGYELATAEFGAAPTDDASPQLTLINPRSGRPIVVQDIVVDVALPQILAAPDRFSVLATLNVNGDFLVDALGTLAGGTGLFPSASLGDTIALFEVTHGPASHLAGQDCADPTPLLLAAEMMLRHIGWDEAGDCLIEGLRKSIALGYVTQPAQDQALETRVMRCSEFGEQVIRAMG